MSEQGLTVAEAAALPERDIEAVTTEIIEICRQAQVMALSCAVEVGRRLCEAKELLRHGEWGDWLKERVAFSQSTANNLMRLYREYGSQSFAICGVIPNSQVIANLPYTKALRLLAIPAEEREEFAEEHRAAEISSKELEQAIRERNEALRERDAALEAARRLEELEAEAKRAGVKLAMAEHVLEQKAQELQEAEERTATLERELEELRRQSAELPAQRLAELEAKAKAGAEKEFRKDRKELRGRIAELEAELAGKVKMLEKLRGELEEAGQSRRADEEAARRYEDEIARLRKQAAMADPDTTEFRTVLDGVQRQLARLREIIARVEPRDAERAGRLRQALLALSRSLLESCDGAG